MKRLSSFYYTLNPVSFILVNFLLIFPLVTVPFVLMVYIFNWEDIINNPYKGDFSVSMFIIAVVIAPLMETLIFQYGIIKIFTYLNPKTKYIAVFISAVLFALSHWFSWVYILFAFMFGIFLGFLYLTSEKRGFKPYWIIAAVHCLYNLFVTFIDFITTVS